MVTIIILDSATNLRRVSAVKKAASKFVRSAKAPRLTVGNANGIISVDFAEDEEVQWNWTHMPQGSYVSGYTLIKKKRSKL